MGKLVLILGGARSGKSRTAERMALDLGAEHVLYIATAEAHDAEMRERIAMHQATRPPAWQTLEALQDIAGRLEGTELPTVVVLDCITLLVSNVLLGLADDCPQADANQAVLREINNLLARQHTSASTWIIVSNEVGMGVVPPYRLGRVYRDVLGNANQRLAQAADEVQLMVAGLPWRLKSESHY
jgi:adenosylcobinamide kinase / adenosylcobinamide-phosphate guanylyltransferase